MKILPALTASLILGFTSAAIAKDHGHKRFEKLDSNGDEQISFEEFQSIGAGKRERPHKGDLDGDGLVSQEEVDQKIAERTEKMQGRMQERFAEMDIDSNGLVTPEEAKQAMFNRLDINEDGVLSKRELRHAKRPQRH